MIHKLACDEAGFTLRSGDPGGRDYVVYRIYSLRLSMFSFSTAKGL